MLIIPSKQLLLITAQQSKEVFLFDPKTTSVITKYQSQASIAKTLAYYPHSNQFLTSFTNKTFVNIWSTDCQQPINKVSTIDMITYLLVSRDGNVLFAGSHAGNLYVWELPTGILIKKTSCHSGEIRKIIQYKPGYLMTCTQKEVKIWSLSSFYLQTQRSTPIKIINSVLDIIDVEHVRNIFAVLTSKSVTYYLGGNQNNPFPQINKQDMQFPTTICSSLSHLYIGDFQGSIHAKEIITSENSYELNFHYNNSSESLEVQKLTKKILLISETKHPITCLIHMKTSPYLISGNTQGDIFIWQNHVLKRQLKLFKTSIKFIHSLPKPSEQKVPQNLKIRPMAKYEQNKETQPLQVDIERLKQNQFYSEQSKFDLQKQVQHIQQSIVNDLILQKMLEVLNRPDEILRSKISQLEDQNQKLIKATLHYSSLLCEQRQNAKDDIDFY